MNTDKNIKSQQPAKPAATPAPQVTNNKEAEVKPPILSPAFSVMNQKMNLLDVISPQSVEVDFDYIKINDVYFRTIFVKV